MTDLEMKAAAYDKLVAEIRSLQKTHHAYEEPLSTLDYVCTLNALFSYTESVDYELTATFDGRYPF
jgi:hypothetical protein